MSTGAAIDRDDAPSTPGSAAAAAVAAGPMAAAAAAQAARGATPAVAPDTLRPLVYAEQVRTAYGAKPALLPSTVIPNLAVALFLVAVMWGKVETSTLISWFGAQLAYQVVRVWINLRYWRANPPLHEAWRWARLYVWQTTTNGCLWGIAGLVMFVSDSITYQAVLFATLCGFAAASVTITAMLLPAFLGSVLPVMIIITARTVAEGNATHYALAGMLAVFGIYIVSRGVNMHLSLIHI